MTDVFDPAADAGTVSSISPARDRLASPTRIPLIIGSPAILLSSRHLSL